MLQHLFAWRRGLLSASPARPLFLVFRDCCLTPPQKFRCSFQHGIWAYGTAAAAVCLALPLAVCIASTGFFFSLPRLLLDPPSKVPLQLPNQLFFWRSRFPCVRLQLGVWACGIQLAVSSGTASFSSVPRLPLDPPQKSRCSFPTNWLASGPVAPSLV